MTHTASGLRFTVIIPLEFHRDQAEECLRRWTREQAYARSRYEILAVACRYSLSQEAFADLRAQLGPDDRLLLYDAPHDMALCAQAAGEAQGEVLLFTESHCLPEPNVLALADEVLQTHPDWAGFSGSTTRIIRNRLSVVEADMYEADTRDGMEQHSWRKVLDACFVVRVEHYHAAGGFRPELGHFAEWHLAARLHQQGYAIGYAPEVQVWHYYPGDIPALIEFSTDFTRGEMMYGSECVDDPSHSYFPEQTEWSKRYQWLPTLAQAAFLLAGRARSKCITTAVQPHERLVRYRLLLVWGLRACFGYKPAHYGAILRFWASLWTLRLCLLLRLDRRPLLTAFLRLIDATVRRERLRFVGHWLDQQGTQSISPSTDASALACCWQPDNAHLFRSIGFHAAEQWQGTRFRWSEPVGMIELSLPPGDYHFAIEWLPIKDIENLVVYLDEQPVSIEREACKASSVLQITSSCPARISWTCEPWTADRDPRLLGLPVVSISWTHVNTAEHIAEKIGRSIS